MSNLQIACSTMKLHILSSSNVFCRRIWSTTNKSTIFPISSSCKEWWFINSLLLIFIIAYFPVWCSYRYSTHGVKPEGFSNGTPRSKILEFETTIFFSLSNSVIKSIQSKKGMRKDSRIFAGGGRIFNQPRRKE